MSSTIKKQRTVLEIRDGSMTEKIKTVSTILKNIGSKIVKNDQLTLLPAKNRNNNEIRGNLSKHIEKAHYDTLVEYLYAFCQKWVVTTR